jgi:hypothetical protein
MLLKAASIAITLLLISSVVHSAEVHPQSKKEMFALGQTMAECAAFFKVIASLPLVQDKPETARLAENKASGWKMAGVFWMLSGSAGNAELHVAETADAIINLKQTEYLSIIELKGTSSFDEITKEFQIKCMPIVPIQERTIQTLRSSN